MTYGRPAKWRGWAIGVAALVLLLLILHWLYAPSIACRELGGRWDYPTSTCMGNAYPLPETWWPFE